MIRHLRLALPAAAAALGLSACATVGPRTSYVAPLPLPSSDAVVLASGITRFMAAQLPAGATTLALDPTPSDQASNALTPELATALRRRGFAVAASAAAGQTHTLRYWVTPLDSAGEVVRLLIDGHQEASRFFVRNTAGYLQAGGPFTVTQMEASR